MSTSTIRHPAVAGRFYPREPEILRKEVASYLSHAESAKQESIRALGCIAPHAGYMYSGPVAGAVFARLQIPTRVVLLCPNHTGLGRPLAVMSDGEWEDSAAHRAEHAAEVELPFLLLRQPQLTFVPIALGTGQFEPLQQLGEALADVIAARKEDVLIVASSDMNHYESDAVTRVKDHRAIERILSLDPRGLYDVVTQQDISMCGFGPAVAMLMAATRLGAKSAELVKYATSGDVSGDRDMVVGYAGIVVR